MLFIAGLFYFLFKPAKKISQTSQNKKIEISNTIEIITQNLDVPWALDFLPDKSILFTERAGNVRMIDKNGKLLETPISKIQEVLAIGEGGLLGIAIHPDFEINHYVYFYYTYQVDANNTFNRVARYTFDGKILRDAKIIVDKIPGAALHNGGRIKFGPDKYLYITTGDAKAPSLAQDRNSLSGKILRVINPSVDSEQVKIEVYSYGHRNPQGLAWDNKGQLFATEHGSNATDEINLIKNGGNYGWPIIREDEKREGIISPLLQSGHEIWAPSGMAFKNNSLFFGGLRGEALFQLTVSDGAAGNLKRYFVGKFGRIRDVVLGPDGFLYITTSNRDGRGTIKSEDDKIIRITSFSSD